MTKIPTGTELARAFLPTKDLEQSKRFYLALGFEMVLDSVDVAIFAVGEGGFILQRRFVQEWAENCMMQLMVDDLGAWWAHLQGLKLTERFDLPFQPKPPALQSWGLEVAFIADPAGVLWHVAQRRPATPHD